MQRTTSQWIFYERKLFSASSLLPLLFQPSCEYWSWCCLAGDGEEKWKIDNKIIVFTLLSFSELPDSKDAKPTEECFFNIKTVLLGFRGTNVNMEKAFQEFFFLKIIEINTFPPDVGVIFVSSSFFLFFSNFSPFWKYFLSVCYYVHIVIAHMHMKRKEFKYFPLWLTKSIFEKNSLQSLTFEYVFASFLFFYDDEWRAIKESDSCYDVNQKIFFKI